ncbi:DNA-binding protein creA like [Verticillium longisporum]|uniref:DNA-binding protein creA like n=1 Tax=Verticillium longisporum TaxID=100787 RepID=A0A8I3AK00_VERLO|nr:DNA-binding protein creA like [Verticillium longisporum]
MARTRWQTGNSKPRIFDTVNTASVKKRTKTTKKERARSEDGPVPEVHLLDKKLPCPYCDKTYRKVDYLTRHLRNHAPKLIYYCNLPGCSKTFVRLDLCKRHTNRHVEKGLESKGFTMRHVSPITDRDPGDSVGSASPETNLTDAQSTDMDVQMYTDNGASPLSATGHPQPDLSSSTAPFVATEIGNLPDFDSLAPYHPQNRACVDGRAANVAADFPKQTKFNPYSFMPISYDELGHDNVAALGQQIEQYFNLSTGDA